jgi:hypothetical protein
MMVGLVEVRVNLARTPGAHGWRERVTRTSRAGVTRASRAGARVWVASQPEILLIREEGYLAKRKGDEKRDVRPGGYSQASRSRKAVAMTWASWLTSGVTVP